MACPRIDHRLFQKIKAEHELILSALESWSLLPSDDEKKQKGLWLWHFVELQHHDQEERLIFQALYNHPKIGEGGPLCTLYFDFHMADNPMHKAEILSKQTPVLEEHHKAFYNTGSPVRVPLEEHRGGKEVLRYLLHNWSGLSEKEKLNCMNTYKDIQTQHILKEETCFFHLCLRLLSEDELNHLADSWVTS